MARASQNTTTETTLGAWKGDYGSRDHLVPGGIILDAAAFAALAGTPYTVAGRTRVPSGVAVGRTFAEQAANAVWGPAAATDDEIFLLAFGTDALEINPDGTLYRHASIVKENYLPEVIAATMIAGVLTKIRDKYVCTLGTD